MTENVWEPGAYLEDDGVIEGGDSLEGGPDYDPLDEGLAAADDWSPAERFGTTLAECREGESLDELLAEEEPDRPSATWPRPWLTRGTPPVAAELAALHLEQPDEEQEL